MPAFSLVAQAVSLRRVKTLNHDRLSGSDDMARSTTTTGAAILLAIALWFGLTSSTLAQRDRGDPAPTLTPPPGVTPTPDRLAAPPTVPSPNQADEGAQIYWLHCQPCHGDVGQGLTDEWRAQYPVEEQNCWQSGCHGPSPYQQSHALPETVPAVIGEGALAKFESMEQVYTYIKGAMPLFYPGSLSEEEYLSLAAHLARENNLWDGQTLTAGNLNRYQIGPAEPTAALPLDGLMAASSTPAPPATTGANPRPDTGMWLLIGIISILFAGGFLAWKRHNP